MPYTPDPVIRSLELSGSCTITIDDPDAIPVTLNLDLIYDGLTPVDRDNDYPKLTPSHYIMVDYDLNSKVEKFANSVEDDLACFTFKSELVISGFVASGPVFTGDALNPHIKLPDGTKGGLNAGVMNLTDNNGVNLDQAFNAIISLAVDATGNMTVASSSITGSTYTPATNLITDDLDKVNKGVWRIGGSDPTNYLTDITLPDASANDILSVPIHLSDVAPNQQDTTAPLSELENKLETITLGYKDKQCLTGYTITISQDLTNDDGANPNNPSAITRYGRSKGKHDRYIFEAGDLVVASAPAAYELSIVDAAGDSRVILAPNNVYGVVRHSPDTEGPTFSGAGLANNTLSEGGGGYNVADNVTANDNRDVTVTMPAPSVAPNADGDAFVAPYKVGSYTVTYSATDAAGNSSTTTKVITVVDDTAPIITLTGPDSVDFNVGDIYNELRATALDVHNDTLLTDYIVIGGDLIDGQLLTTAGGYSVTYNVNDLADIPNSAVTKTRIVNVHLVPGDLKAEFVSEVLTNDATSRITLRYSNIGSVGQDSGGWSTSGKDYLNIFAEGTSSPRMFETIASNVTLVSSNNGTTYIGNLTDGYLGIEPAMKGGDHVEIAFDQERAPLDTVYVFDVNEAASDGLHAGEVTSNNVAQYTLTADTLPLSQTLKMGALSDGISTVTGTGGNDSWVVDISNYLADLNAERLAGVDLYTDLKFADSGGTPSDYSQSEFYQLSFAAEPGQRIDISGTIDTEGGFDKLHIYDSSANFNNARTTGGGAVYETLDGTTGVDITIVSGQVWFIFESDGSAQQTGWDLTITAYTPVPDILPPVFDLGTDGADVELNEGTMADGYDLKNTVTANDAEDGDVAVEIYETHDAEGNSINWPGQSREDGLAGPRNGVYTVTYSATDAAGNEDFATRTITVYKMPNNVKLTYRHATDGSPNIVHEFLALPVLTSVHREASYAYAEQEGSASTPILIKMDIGGSCHGIKNDTYADAKCRYIEELILPNTWTDQNSGVSVGCYSEVFEDIGDYTYGTDVYIKTGKEAADQGLDSSGEKTRIGNIAEALVIWRSNNMANNSHDMGNYFREGSSNILKPHQGGTSGHDNLRFTFEDSDGNDMVIDYDTGNVLSKETIATVFKLADASGAMQLVSSTQSIAKLIKLDISGSCLGVGGTILHNKCDYLEELNLPITFVDHEYNGSSYTTSGYSQYEAFGDAGTESPAGGVAIYIKTSAVEQWDGTFMANAFDADANHQGLGVANDRKRQISRSKDELIDIWMANSMVDPRGSVWPSNMKDLFRSGTIRYGGVGNLTGSPNVKFTFKNVIDGSANVVHAYDCGTIITADIVAKAHDSAPADADTSKLVKLDIGASTTGIRGSAFNNKCNYLEELRLPNTWGNHSEESRRLYYSNGAFGNLGGSTLAVGGCKVYVKTGDQSFDALPNTLQLLTKASDLIQHSTNMTVMNDNLWSTSNSYLFAPQDDVGHANVRFTFKNATVNSDNVVVLRDCGALVDRTDVELAYEQGALAGANTDELLEVDISGSVIGFSREPFGRGGRSNPQSAMSDSIYKSQTLTKLLLPNTLVPKMYDDAGNLLSGSNAYPYTTYGNPNNVPNQNNIYKAFWKIGANTTNGCFVGVKNTADQGFVADHIQVESTAAAAALMPNMDATTKTKMINNSYDFLDEPKFLPTPKGHVEIEWLDAGGNVITGNTHLTQADHAIDFAWTAQQLTAGGFTNAQKVYPAKMRISNNTPIDAFRQPYSANTDYTQIALCSGYNTFGSKNNFASIEIDATTAPASTTVYEVLNHYGLYKHQISPALKSGDSLVINFEIVQPSKDAADINTEYYLSVLSSNQASTSNNSWSANTDLAPPRNSAGDLVKVTLEPYYLILGQGDVQIKLLSSTTANGIPRSIKFERTDVAEVIYNSAGSGSDAYKAATVDMLFKNGEAGTGVVDVQSGWGGSTYYAKNMYKHFTTRVLQTVPSAGTIVDLGTTLDATGTYKLTILVDNMDGDEPAPYRSGATSFAAEVKIGQGNGTVIDEKIDFGDLVANGGATATYDSGGCAIESISFTFADIEKNFEALTAAQRGALITASRNELAKDYPGSQDATTRDAAFSANRLNVGWLPHVNRGGEVPALQILYKCEASNINIGFNNEVRFKLSTSPDDPNAGGNGINENVHCCYINDATSYNTNGDTVVGGASGTGTIMLGTSTQTLGLELEDLLAQTGYYNGYEYRLANELLYRLYTDNLPDGTYYLWFNDSYGDSWNNGPHELTVFDSSGNSQMPMTGDNSIAQYLGANEWRKYIGAEDGKIVVGNPVVAPTAPDMTGFSSANFANAASHYMEVMIDGQERLSLADGTGDGSFIFARNALDVLHGHVANSVAEVTVPFTIAAQWVLPYGSDSTTGSLNLFFWDGATSQEIALSPVFTFDIGPTGPADNVTTTASYTGSR